jgi:hypothetical protein
LKPGIRHTIFVFEQLALLRFRANEGCRRGAQRELIQRQLRFGTAKWAA